MYFSLIKYGITFTLALAASLLLVPVAKRLAPLLGLVDEPSARRIHQRPIPRSGGLAVFMATHLALLFVTFGPWRNLGGAFDLTEWLYMLLGSTILLTVGLIDDRCDISAWVKLGGQLGVAALMFCCGFSFETLLGYPVPWVVNFGVTLFWFTLLINAFNLIDGMDGACAGLGSISGLAMVALLAFLHQPSDALVILALVGACLGFLRYNFHPASIFLGDCGSMFIGFMLAAVSLKANVAQSMSVAILVPLLAVGVPVFDVMVAVWRRTARKMVAVLRHEQGECRVFGPDLDHIHHKLLKKGLGQRQAALALYAGAAFVCLAALGCTMAVSYRSAILMISIMIMLHVVVRQLVHLELWNSTQVLLNGLRRPSAVIRLMLQLGCDTFIFSVATLASCCVLGAPFGLLKLVVCVLVPLLTLHGFGIYRTIWSRSRPSQLFKLGLEVVTAEMVAYVILQLLIPQDETIAPGQVLHALLAVMGVTGIRMIPRVLHDMSSGLRRFQPQEDAVRALLLGAGNESLLYLRRASQQDCSRVSRVISGLVDNDPALQGMTVYGYRVLGKMQDLEALIRTHGVSELLICARMSAAERCLLLQLKERHGITLREFRSGLVDFQDAPAAGSMPVSSPELVLGSGI